VILLHGDLTALAGIGFKQDDIAIFFLGDVCSCFTCSATAWC
jgi:hypothetical protein